MSQTSTSQPPAIKSRIGAILRATSGNFLEQFDFFLFGFYASAIAKAFFPAQNETAALLNAFGVFWLGALMRPVGAIVLGAYIDRIGRRQGLIVTLGIMAIGTVVIAYATGYAATRRSLPLGGAGVTEALMTYALYWCHQPLAPALVAVLVYRCFNFLLVAVPAVIAHRQLEPVLAGAHDATG